jgi:hypothetical protein
VPSRIGSETEAVLGATHPNGTTIKEIEEAARLEAELAAHGGVDGQGLGGSGGGSGGGARTVTEDGFDKEHEARYGPRRTAVLFLSICGVAFALWALLRWRGAFPITALSARGFPATRAWFVQGGQLTRRVAVLSKYRWTQT